MEKQALREIIAEQKTYPFPKRLIQRDIFNNQKLLKKVKFIHIFSGIRRSGKSIVVQTIRNNNKEQDYYFNFEDDRLVHFTVDDFQKLYEVFIEEFGEQNTFYFDEIQNIPYWEKFVRRLSNAGHKIYITGSNAHLLSKELGTHLTGRYIQTEIFPYSFSEYLHFIKCTLSPKKTLTTTEKITINKHFKKYLKNGGFPEFLETKNVQYLKQLYDNILYRDIIVRYNLPNEKVLKECGLYCASNIGKLLSFNSLKSVLGLGSATTAKEYLSYFENSYLFFVISKYNYSLKKQVYSPKKVYCIDTGLAMEIGFQFSQDKGRYLENIVFIELKRRNKTIFYHKMQKECDFVIQKGINITEVIQVSMSLENLETKQREIDGLKEAMQEYNIFSGLILTEEEEGEIQIDQKYTIIIMPIWKWLLN